MIKCDLHQTDFHLWWNPISGQEHRVCCRPELSDSLQAEVSKAFLTQHPLGHGGLRTRGYRASFPVKGCWGLSSRPSEHWDNLNIFHRMHWPRSTRQHWGTPSNLTKHVLTYSRCRQMHCFEELGSWSLEWLLGGRGWEENLAKLYWLLVMGCWLCNWLN